MIQGNIISALARRSLQKFENAARLLRYNNNKCYVNNINAVLKSFCCPSCDNFFNKASNLERHETTCRDRVENLYPKNFYQFRETLVDKFLLSWKHVH